MVERIPLFESVEDFSLGDLELPQKTSKSRDLELPDWLRDSLEGLVVSAASPDLRLSNQKKIQSIHLRMKDTLY